MIDSPNSIVLNMITDFTKEYIEFWWWSQGFAKPELSGGARISYKFSMKCKAVCILWIRLIKLKISDIRTIMYNSSGYAPSLFVGTEAFEVWLNNKSRFHSPSEKLVLVDELIRILKQMYLSK